MFEGESAPPQPVDGSAHMLLRAITGLEPALWDLAGKILNVPAADPE
jgi:L-alanine-DL-glutamate epimerase-like enolase superfamily enzyme